MSNLVITAAATYPPLIIFLFFFTFVTKQGREKRQSTGVKLVYEMRGIENPVNHLSPDPPQVYKKIYLRTAFNYSALRPVS